MALQNVTVELFYSSAWHAVPLYSRNPITIGRGDGDEQSDTPASLTLTLNDQAQQFNPRNPAGPLYGLIGRNTPIRVTYPGDARFYGEVASWKPGRSPEFVAGAGRGDAWCEIEAAGVRRRFEQGADPLPSALRSFMDAQPGVIGYWPMEDGANATAASNAVPGGAAAAVVDVAFGSDTALPASAGAMTTNSVDTLFRGKLAVQPATGVVSAVALVKLGATPPGATAVRLFRVFMTGAVASFAVEMDDNGLFARVYDTQAQALLNSELATVVDPTKWVAYHFSLTQQSPGTIAYALYWHQAAVGGADPIWANTGTFSGTLGRATEITIGPDALLAQAKFAHMIVTNAHFPFVTTGLLKAVDAWAGWETALDRLERLCDDAGIAFTSDGEAVELLGAQLPAPLLDLLGEAQRTDDGKLFEPRGSLGLHYRTRRDLYGQAPALTLAWAAGDVKPPLQPVVDDLGTRNDVTVSNAGQGSARAVLEDGPLSVAPPPAGVGRYPTTVDVSHFTDERLPALASWHLHKGTVDETRYSKVTVDVDQVPGAAAVEVGDRIVIEGVPDSTGEADLLVLGYTEVIESHRRLITFTCAPYAPYDTGTWDEDPDVTSARYDTELSETFASVVTGTATSVGVVTARGKRWTTDPAHFPVDVNLRGARVRVTDIDSYFLDEFNRSAASSWGNGWTTSGGTAANYSCNGSDGLISLATINASRRVWRPETFDDVELLVCFESSHLGATDDIELSAAVHMTTQSDYVHLGCFLDGDGTNADLMIVRRVANTPTTISNVRTLSAFQAVGGDRWLRFLATNGTFYGKAWAGVLADEPPDWMVSGSDGTFGSGLAGLRANIQPSYSGAIPVTITVHSFEITNPQTFTISTSVVNGVAKTIPAGSPVRLWRPRRYGL